MAGFKTKAKSGRWHTIYSIISTAIETAAIAAVILWILPMFKINIPWWGTALVLATFLGYCYISYLISHPTVMSDPITAPESIIGDEGVVETDLSPMGYVRVRGELWMALSPDSNLRKGDEIVVTGLSGMKLTVARKRRPAEG